MISEIAIGIWKVSFDSNCYFLDIGEKIMIDCGLRRYRDEIAKELSSLVDLSKITKVLLTHLHYDHSGNADLFPNAEFFASKEAIEDFESNKAEATLGEVADIKLKPLVDMHGLEVIPVPGHTRGSVAFWYPKEKVLFTGDTWFGEKCVGRTDFPTSVPDQMDSSIDNLKKIPFKILCSGHDYV